VFWSPKKPRPFGHRRGTAPTRSSRRNRTRLVGGASGRRRSLPAMLNDRSGGYRRRKDGPNACSRARRARLALSDAVTDRRNEVSIGQRRALGNPIRELVGSSCCKLSICRSLFPQGSPSGAHRRSSLVR
jgi:hypothetical protein